MKESASLRVAAGPISKELEQHELISGATCHCSLCLLHITWTGIIHSYLKYLISAYQQKCSKVFI